MNQDNKENQEGKEEEEGGKKVKERPDKRGLTTSVTWTSVSLIRWVSFNCHSGRGPGENWVTAIWTPQGWLVFHLTVWSGTQRQDWPLTERDSSSVAFSQSLVQRLIAVHWQDHAEEKSNTGRNHGLSSSCGTGNASNQNPRARALYCAHTGTHVRTCARILACVIRETVKTMNTFSLYNSTTIWTCCAIQKNLSIKKFNIFLILMPH